MQLLEFVPFFSVFLIATLGLGSIALSLTVWRRRRRVFHAQTGWLRAVGRILLPLGFVGSLAIALSLSLRTFFPRRGELFVRGATVVRADPLRGLPTLTSADTVAAGETLVTFAQPGQAAEAERLHLMRRRLAAERERLADAPLEQDPVLVRARQELTAERHQLLQRLALFEVEQQRLEQQARTEILDKRVQRHEVRVQIGDYDGQISKVATEIAYEKLRLESGKGLRDENTLSELGFAERRRNVEVLEADAHRLAKEREEKLALLAELQQGIDSLEQMLARHGSIVGAATAEIRTSLLKVANEQEAIDARATADRERIARQRASELHELDLRQADCEQQLRKLADLAQVASPGTAQVLFRHPSPGSAQLGEPLLMFGTADAVRARFKLADREANRLSTAGEIELLATSHELLATKLSGHVVRTEPLEHEPGMALVELACSPSSSQLRYLARGLTLDARLLWTPPAFADPLLLFGALLLLLALLPAVLGRLRSQPRLVLPMTPRSVPASVPASHANSG